MKPQDISGQRFFRLIAVDFSHRNKHGQAMWTCLCDCGQIKVIGANALRSGATKSCGCYNRERAAETATTHGMSKHSAFKTWEGMMRRCYNENDKDYPRYGGRGITVCGSWHDVAKFIEDMGEKPDGKTLDRRNNNLDYNKRNCRWGTPLTQGGNKANNNSATIDGVKYHLAGAARAFGITESTLRNRMNAGYTMEQAVKMPVRNKRQI